MENVAQFSRESTQPMTETLAEHEDNNLHGSSDFPMDPPLR